ncbi:MAG: protein kinase [Acidobacteriia bacterium]|nr:protein kinase [Terriglobia bacterium]
MQLPARIGKYELEEFLGGGMSQVYRARDTVIGRTVAVKILTEAGCEDADVKARFLAEARMAGNIAHDNVLRIYDFGEDEAHRPFLVMEFLRGEDLRHAIKGGRTGDLRGKLAIARQVARALEHIHEQKIIHRDIKPENVHIDEAGVAKLMDFGIAKTEGLQMTRAGYVLGTPYYMAPEQVTGQNVTEQVDVYAFGVLLFELVTGSKPIHGDTVERIFYSILNEPLDLEPMRQAGVPQGLCDLVARCTAKNAGERPRGFAPVCAELERIAGELDGATVALAAPAPARRSWLLPAAVLAALVVAVVLFVALRPKAAPELARSIRARSGEMVLVPAGKFLFGEKKEPVDMPAFYIDRTEVTNALYAAFCNETHRDLPPDFTTGQPDYPVVNVSILDAQAMANWAGERLPTAREWEKAARGTDGRIFPWGNEKDASRANVGTKQVRPAADLAAGASPSGALNMVGNVWEFVYDLTSPSPQALKHFKDLLQPAPAADEPWYTIRGESFQESALDDKVIWDAATVPARWRGLNIGFRCVKDAR